MTETTPTINERLAIIESVSADIQGHTNCLPQLCTDVAVVTSKLEEHNTRLNTIEDRHDERIKNIEAQSWQVKLAIIIATLAFTTNIVMVVINVIPKILE